MRKEKKFTIQHGVQGSIMDNNLQLGGSRHDLTIGYGRKQIKIILDMGSKPNDTNNQLIDDGYIKKADAIIISHAHLDHVGKIQYLPQNGYKNNIYMHTCTDKLVNVLLEDALAQQDRIISMTNEQAKKNRTDLQKANDIIKAHIGVKSTRNKKIDTSLSLEKAYAIFGHHNLDPNRPLSDEFLKTYKPQYIEKTFSRADVQKVLDQITPLDYNKKAIIVKDALVAKFYNAGHILGSAGTLLQLLGDQKKQQKAYTIFYTGDIGRFKQPGKVGQPDIPKEKIDYMIIEGTYGNKLHPDRTEEEKRFIETINKAEGLTIIPCFTIEGMQQVRELLGEAIASKQLQLHPDEYIYFDSKLGYNLSKEYVITDGKHNYRYLKDHPKMKRLRNDNESSEYLNKKETRKQRGKVDTLRTNLKVDPLRKKNMINITKPYKDTTKKGNKILGEHGRVIIVCSGGMGENGTVMHYLPQATKRNNAKIVNTGFQAPGTIGYKLAHNDFSEPLYINGEQIKENKASIYNFAFSRHGDQDDIMTFIKKCNLADNIKINIIHGGSDRKYLAQKIEEYLGVLDSGKKVANRGKWEVIVPEHNGEKISFNHIAK